MPGLTMTFPNGDTLSLLVSEEDFHSSVHGSALTCQSCHQGYEQVPHGAVEAPSYREYTLSYYETCKNCHFDNYAKTLDSAHYETLSKGDNSAPVCTDCHGAHDVSDSDMPHIKIARACSQCHVDIYNAYQESVHGHALVNSGNEDVPTCIDCHGVHDIGDPREPGYRLHVPGICGSCHADEKRMAKYGLSTNVLRTYLNDFHGTTVRLVDEYDPEMASFEAVCSDCHGIHDIVSVKDPSSPVLKANILETCQQCHPDATENFPSAWLSHYEPSLSYAPMVFLVKAFYIILIPLMVSGLVIHVVLDLWRSVIRR